MSIQDITAMFPSKSDAVVKNLASIFGDLGGFGGFSSTENGTLVGNMFLTFNVFLMTLTGFWLTWLFFKSVLNSAHDGEFLGKKYHSAWVPFRTAIGVVSIMPMPFLHGWNLAQAFYGVCILIGTGIGNGVASGAVGYMDITSKKSVSISVVPSLTWYYDKINAARENVASLQNKSIARAQDALGLDRGNQLNNSIIPMEIDINDTHTIVEFATRKLLVTGSNSKLLFAVAYGSKDGFETTGFPAVMNTIILPLGSLKELSKGDSYSALIDSADTANNEAQAASDTFSIESKNAVASAAQQYVIDVDAAYSKAIGNTGLNNQCQLIDWTSVGQFKGSIKQLMTSNNNISECESYSNGNAVAGNPVIGLSPEQETYSERLETLTVDLAVARIKSDSAIRTAILGPDGSGNNSGALANLNSKTLSTAKELVNKRSWFGLGLVLPMAAQRSSDTAKQLKSAMEPFVNNLPSQHADGSPLTPAERTAFAIANGKEIDAKARAYAKEGENSKLNELVSIFDKGLSVWLIEKIQADKNGFEGVLSGAAAGAGDGAIGTSGSLSKMIALGNNAMAMASSLVTALLWLVGLSLAAGMVPGSALFGVFAVLAGALSVAAGIIAPLVIILFGVGISLVVILSFTPMLYWLATLASMLFVYVEAILAAPLWAFAHLNDEGDGMGSSSKKGYVFIFALLFGPAILVISYTICMQIFEILSGIGSGFISMGAVKLLQKSDGLFETVALIIGICSVLFSMHYMLIKICFGQPVTILSKVLGMIGGEWGSNVVGEGGSSAVSDAEGRSKGGASAATGFAAGALAGAVGGKMLSGGKGGGKGGGTDNKDKLSQGKGSNDNVSGSGAASMGDAAKSRDATATAPAPAPASAGAGGDSASGSGLAMISDSATPTAPTTPTAQASGEAEGGHTTGSLVKNQFANIKDTATGGDAGIDHAVQRDNERSIGAVTRDTAVTQHAAVPAVPAMAPMTPHAPAHSLNVSSNTAAPAAQQAPASDTAKPAAQDKKQAPSEGFKLNFAGGLAAAADTAKSAAKGLGANVDQASKESKPMDIAGKGKDNGGYSENEF